jgi:septal ring factor EnvC (AmiA/AmiB activator)
MQVSLDAVLAFFLTFITLVGSVVGAMFRELRAEHKASVELLTGHIGRLDTAMKLQGDKIATIEGERNALLRQITELRIALGEKEREISELRENLEAREIRITALEGQVARLQVAEANRPRDNQ